MEFSYFPNYYVLDDIFVTQQKVECRVNAQLLKMGFLDSNSGSDDLQPGKIINLPLWYIKEQKINNPYFTILIPDIYKNVHKAVCEAETTHIELGKLHPYFYEYGHYLTPHDQSCTINKIVFETIRHRIRHLLDMSKNFSTNHKPELRLDKIENKLFEMGIHTNKLYIDWLRVKGNNLNVSELVYEHSKKRKRNRTSSAEYLKQHSKRQCI